MAAVARGVDRIDDDRVDAVGDEVLHLAELLGDVVLGVLDLQRHARLRLGVIGHAVAQTVRKLSSNLSIDTPILAAKAGLDEHGGGGERNKHAFHFISSLGAAPRRAD